jgi:hypothetical protein
VEFGILVYLAFDELLEVFQIFITFDLAGCPPIPELVDGLHQLRSQLLASLLEVPQGVALGDYSDYRHRHPDAHVDEEVLIGGIHGANLLKLGHI